MRAELQAIVDELLAVSAETGAIELDAVGEAIGARAVTTPEIEAIFEALEHAGRKLVGPSGGAGEDRLRAVVSAARSLATSLRRKPTIAEIGQKAGLSEQAVKHALALLEVMQR